MEYFVRSEYIAESKQMENFWIVRSIGCRGFMPFDFLRPPPEGQGTNDAQSKVWRLLMIPSM